MALRHVSRGGAAVLGRASSCSPAVTELMVSGSAEPAAVRCAAALLSTAARYQQPHCLAEWARRGHADGLWPEQGSSGPRSCSGSPWRTVRWATGDAKSDAHESSDADKTDGEASGSGAEAEGSPEHAEAATPDDAEGDDASKIIEQAKEAEAKLKEQVDQLTDRLKRSLAEMENVRTRSAREVETAKKFGAQPLIKDLLDIPDNLERAAASVPDELPDDTDKLQSLLKGLQEGVLATEKIMLSVLRKQGVEQFNPVGEKFNPELHNALFEVPDTERDAGIVAVVTKRGYKMHERVVRPADVGVTRAP